VPHCACPRPALDGQGHLFLTDTQKRKAGGHTPAPASLAALGMQVNITPLSFLLSPTSPSTYVCHVAYLWAHQTSSLCPSWLLVTDLLSKLGTKRCLTGLLCATHMFL
jgi:hypothetical protein